MPTEELRVDIRLRDFFTRQLKRAAGAIARFASFTANKFRALGRAITSFRGLLVGLGAGILVKSFIEAGNAMEKFRIQLNAVFGQNKALAQQTLKWVRDFAAVTPFTTKAVIESFVTMKAAGIDATKSMLDTIGNVAFVFDRNISDLSVALVSMEKEVFQKLGIGWEIVGDKARITLGGMVKETAKTRDAMRKGILELWTKAFPGAMKEAEKTWSGLIALLQSQWFEFQADVMDSGVFEFIKEGVRVVGASFQGMAADPQRTGEQIIEMMEFVVRSLAMVANGVKVLGLAFVGLGIVVKGITLAVKGAFTLMTKGLAELFSLFQQVIIKMQAVGPVRKAIESIFGSLDGLRAGLQSAEEAMTSFAQTGKEGMKETAFDIKIMKKEFLALQVGIPTEEVDAFFEKVRRGLEVTNQLKGLTNEFIRLSKERDKLRDAKDFEKLMEVLFKLGDLTPRFQAFGERGAVALALAEKQARLMAKQVERAAVAAKKVAEEAKQLDPSKWLQLAQAATVAEGPAMEYVLTLDMIADAWEKIQKEAKKAEETQKKIFDTRNLKEANDALREWQQTLNEVKDAATAVGSILVNNIMRSIEAAQQGTLRWKQALVETAQELGKMLLRQALMAAVQFGAGALAGAVAGPAPVGYTPPPPGATVPPAPPPPGGFAKGGRVWGIGSAQTGTIFQGDQLIRVGDNRSKQEGGIFPLARGKHGEMGVQAVGGGGGPSMVINFNLQNIDAKGTEEWLWENRGKMGDMMGINRAEGRTDRPSF